MSGDNFARKPPSTGGKSNLDPAAGPVQPIQWTCPRTSYDTPSYPADSDGLSGVGIADPENQGAGVGFPDQNCDAYASPLRADIHFPSCYNPKAGLRDYENNTAWPSSKGTTGGKANCPEGWIHTPHIFYEVYWDTQAFKDEWTQGQGKQPFILANGDRTGYSMHGDFVCYICFKFDIALADFKIQIAGWDEDVLQNIIDKCDGGDAGMEACSTDITGPQYDTATAASCNIPNIVPEEISGALEKLPGNNPPTGWGVNEHLSLEKIALSIPGVSITLGGFGASGTSAANVDSSQPSAPTSVASSPTAEPEPAYTTVTITNPASETTAVSGSSSGMPSGWTYHGCYSDDISNRALTGAEFVNLGIGAVTSTGCADYCEKNGFSFAGTEYAGECFCGNNLTGSSKLADDKCNMKCDGDSSQTCGGSSALSIWQKASSATKRSRAHFLRHLHGVHS